MDLNTVYKICMSCLINLNIITYTPIIHYVLSSYFRQSCNRRLFSVLTIQSIEYQEIVKTAYSLHPNYGFKLLLLSKPTVQIPMTNDKEKLHILTIKKLEPTNAFALKRDALLCCRQVKIICASALLFTVNPARADRDFMVHSGTPLKL